MTNEEAIIRAITYHDLYDVVQGDLSWIPVLVESAKKHIPKKATLNKMKLPACPECGCALAYNINGATNKIYCYNCGQAIDWSKE